MVEKNADVSVYAGSAIRPLAQFCVQKTLGQQNPVTPPTDPIVHTLWLGIGLGLELGLGVTPPTDPRGQG